MNVAYYEAISRLPLGTAVAVEFTGPVLVAALASRRFRDIGAVGLAAVGVLLIADVRWSGSPVGVLWALGAAAMWAAYIVLGKRVARAGSGIDDLATGFTVAAVVLVPLLFVGGPGATTGFGVANLAPLADPAVLALSIGLGVLSSLIPYVLDQVVLRRVRQASSRCCWRCCPPPRPWSGSSCSVSCPGRWRRSGSAWWSSPWPCGPATATNRSPSRHVRPGPGRPVLTDPP